MTKFRARKRFGQNFLVNQGVIKKIADIVHAQQHKHILEIGPGKGALTNFLVKSDARIYAIEIDRDLARELQDRFGNLSHFHLFNEDFLEFDFSQILTDDRFVVAGNIPYNITTPIITKLLEWRKNIDFAVLMVQWEVAKRIVAAPKDGKDYGSLSLAIQYYAETEICFKVKRGSFYPVPNVDSALIKLKFRENPAVMVKDEHLLFDLVHQAFQFRRKMLVNCLKRPPFNLSSEQVAAIGEGSKIDLNQRGEELSLEEFALLAVHYSGIVAKR